MFCLAAYSFLLYAYIVQLQDMDKLNFSLMKKINQDNKIINRLNWKINKIRIRKFRFSEISLFFHKYY